MVQRFVTLSAIRPPTFASGRFASRRADPATVRACARSRSAPAPLSSALYQRSPPTGFRGPYCRTRFARAWRLKPERGSHPPYYSQGSHQVAAAPDPAAVVGVVSSLDSGRMICRSTTARGWASRIRLSGGQSLALATDSVELVERGLVDGEPGGIGRPRFGLVAAKERVVGVVVELASESGLIDGDPEDQRQCQQAAIDRWRAGRPVVVRTHHMNYGNARPHLGRLTIVFCRLSLARYCGRMLLTACDTDT